MTHEEFNQRLGQACQACGAACCKQGRIFLLRSEHDAMRERLRVMSPSEVEKFDDRVADHGAFLIYDQKSRCQFLSDGDLCSLHTLRLKPTECLWWPYHVYAHEEGGLEVRLSRSCCDAHQMGESLTAYAERVAADVRGIGFAALVEFRRIFPGDGQSTPLMKLAGCGHTKEADVRL